MLRVFVSSPKLFSFSDMFEIQAYGLFFVMGLVCFMWFFLQRATKSLQVSVESLIDVVLVSLIAGIAGARLLYVFEFPELLDQGFLSVVDPRTGGLSVLGGLIAAPIAGIYACRFASVEVSSFFDLAAMYAPLIDIFGRLGCFFAGCCYGIPVGSFFSVVYLDVCVAAPTGIDLIPIQFIASVAFVALFMFLRAFAWALRRMRLEAPGTVTFLYFAGAGLIRFFIDFFRGDRSMAFAEVCFGGLALSITWYQIISLAFSLFSLVSVGMLLIRAKSASPESV